MPKLAKACVSCAVLFVFDSSSSALSSLVFQAVFEIENISLCISFLNGR